jgi:hypothetical protein
MASGCGRLQSEEAADVTHRHLRAPLQAPTQGAKAVTIEVAGNRAAKRVGNADARLVFKPQLGTGGLTTQEGMSRLWQKAWAEQQGRGGAH